jgi:hypothetical protein
MKAATLLFLLVSVLISSCTTDTDELRYKLKQKNEKYLDRQERWKMRREARQERTDAWFERWMGD